MNNDDAENASAQTQAAGIGLASQCLLLPLIERLQSKGLLSHQDILAIVFSARKAIDSLREGYSSKEHIEIAKYVLSDLEHRIL